MAARTGRAVQAEEVAKILLPTWPAPVIESVCEVLADTDQGFTNAEIDRLLAMVGIPDSVGPNKRTRLSNPRRFFARAIEYALRPAEVTTDRAPAYPRVLDALLPATHHVTEQHANNRIEADHGRLKARLRPMRGLKRLRSTRLISAGHALVQNLCRGH